jgi:hypothetical protein
MEYSDFDYALSLHMMLNGESAIENIAVNEPTGKLKDPKREASSDSDDDEDFVEEIMVKNFKS